MIIDSLSMVLSHDCNVFNEHLLIIRWESYIRFGKIASHELAVKNQGRITESDAIE